MEIKPCPFCGGKAKISYKDYKFYGRNGMGDKKQKYRLQVICNRCRSRGKPIVTDWLINPNPYAMFRKEQADMFSPYIAKAAEAWNRRTVGWISVKERLPQDEQWVAALLYGFVGVIRNPASLQYNATKRVFIDEDGIEYDIDDVAYWVGLPEPPEVEE